MRPVVTPAEMAAIDAEAEESVDELIGRAAWAVHRAAAEMLDHSLYGKRIVVAAGKGNNGEDGRRAVPHLERAGARCAVFEAGTQPVPAATLTQADLVIDACYGTGLTRDFDAGAAVGDPGTTPVLAVDIASGVDGLTGRIRGQALCATNTITFAALKPGLLLEPGRGHCGRVTVADIGLDCSRATRWQVTPEDVAGLWPRRETGAHKWQQAVYVVGGSPGMTGAPTLSATAALRSGAGYVALSVPGASPVDNGWSVQGSGDPIEAVGHPVTDRWASEVLGRLDRFSAVVVGPGLRPGDGSELRRYVTETTTPTVFDAGALASLAEIDGLARSSGVLHIVTPHEGEFTVLSGGRIGPDRIQGVQDLAARLQAVVLLKGATTVVAHPDGRVLLSTGGDARLATAGTGDVLSGVIAAAVAGGLDSFRAAAVGAELHGLAARTGRRVGLVAGDLPMLVSGVLSDLADGTGTLT